jgi:hypothetical protein
MMRLFGNTGKRRVSVTGIATASYTTGKCIGTSFAIGDVNSADSGYMITDELIYIAMTTAPNVDLFLFDANPSATDNGAIPSLANCIGVVANADITWVPGAADYVGRAQMVFSGRAAGGQLYGLLVSRATQSIPQGKDLVGLKLGLSRD